MLEGNIYAVTGLVSAFVCLAIYRCNNTIYEKDNKIRSYFSFLLINFIFCNLIDVLWGFMNTKTIDPGRGSFVAVSFLIHLDVIFVAACWCIFLTSYFGYKENRAVMILQCFPLAIALVILAGQFVSNTVFVIDENGAYSSGPFRLSMFYIQYSYYVIAFVKIIYFVIRNRHESTYRYKTLVIGSSLIPIAFGILQYRYPDGPYTSLGFVLSSIVVFNGMMVIEKSRNSKRYEVISKGTYMTLEAVTQGFVSAIMVDLVKGNFSVIKSTPYADALVERDKPIREMILKVFRNAVKPEFLDEIMEFADIDKLPEKMVNRRSISTQYCSEGIGWCIASFIAVERDEERNLRKVVLVVQSIDEFKKRELEYENALSRAYKNENAILAELIKMQAVGVLASDENRRILVANDALLEMFDRKGSDPIGMNVFNFWNESRLPVDEETRARYDRIEAEGGEFTYELETGEGDDVSYLMAEAKRVDLLDGTKVMVSCFTDITQAKILEEKLRTLSETDGLTRIANRRCGESQINVLLQEGIPGTYCLFDVDGFKKINDTYGHQTGDDTIVAVANAMKASFRSNDIFMRLGGDEFAIYIRGVVTTELARIKIARLFENIARIELPNVPKGSINISLGAVVVKAKDGVIMEDYASIYKRADTQMYKCKEKTGSVMSIEEGKQDEES